ncbi:hypothetical protein Tco_1117724, partial [Tanacetum coccineum]
VIIEPDLEKEVVAMGPLVNKRRQKIGNDEKDTCTPSKTLPSKSSRKTATEIPTGNVATTEVQGQMFAESPNSRKSASFPSVYGSLGDACQDMVDHIVPPGYFSELHHLPNTDFLSQCNINMARQVAMGSQLRLRFEQEVKLLKKATTKIAKQNQTKNLEALLEAEVDMKKAAETKNAKLTKELESLRGQFSDLQVSNTQLSQQVSNLQAQVTGEEKIKSAFEEFKKYEDDKVEQRCVEMDARMDKLSVDFGEELYPHMLTTIVGRRWVIGHGLRLAVMKCAESPELRQAFADVVSAGLVKGMSEGLKQGIEHGKADQDLAAVEAYDPEADSKYVKALQDLKDLKYPLVDQLEGLKDAPMDLIMTSLHLESNSGEDAPNPWAFKEEMLLEDVIAANISRAEKKKKCRVVCRTHGIGSAYHVRSVPTVAPQGLAILLADAATQTEVANEGDEPRPRLHRSISLPPFYNLEWK